MRMKWWVVLTMLFVIPGVLFATSCAKKAVQTETSLTQTSGGDEAEEQARKAAELAKQQELAQQQELDQQKALEEERLKEEARQRALEAARQQFQNEDIYFEFDSSALLSEAQDVLRRKYEWLQDNPAAAVVIEGHCDERGTNEYNLALGDRRATSAKTFLVDLGISEARLTTISYGEERPLDTGHNEEAWAKNRRAHFMQR